MSADPFDIDVELPRRDQYKRPRLIPAGGGERVSFTRASTMANYLADQSGIHTWQKRLLAVGMGLREDLAARAAALPRPHAERCDKKSLTRKQINEDKATNAIIDELIESALESAGATYKANHGNAIHSLTEPDADSDAVPVRMEADVASYFARLDNDGITTLATEVFVVNDTLTAAGTFDHLVRHPEYGIVVLDKKTGQVDGKDLQFAIQLATYAGAMVYDVITDERAPLESLTGGEPINRDVGIVAHIPLGAGRTDLYRIDLTQGFERLATHVRTARSVKDIMTPCATLPSQMTA